MIFYEGRLEVFRQLHGLKPLGLHIKLFPSYACLNNFSFFGNIIVLLLVENSC